jgi:hypothetical protein
MRFACIADSNGFAPGQNVVLKTLKKVMSLAACYYSLMIILIVS